VRVSSVSASSRSRRLCFRKSNGHVTVSPTSPSRMKISVACAGVDLPVAGRTGLELEVVEPAALLHQHPAGLGVPERLAVRHAQQVLAEVEHPLRVDPRAGPGVKPARFHDLRRHEPFCDLGLGRCFPRWNPARGRTLFPFHPLKQRRPRKYIHAPVVRGVVVALVRPGRDVAEQAGQDGAVHGPVGGRAGSELHLLPRLHAVIDGGPRKAGALAQAVLELGIHVTPLSHPHE
jgi:hypothetical protein